MSKDFHCSQLLLAPDQSLFSHSMANPQTVDRRGTKTFQTVENQMYEK
jgi:hypothetical protein